MSDSDTGRASRLVVAAAVLDDLEHPTTLLCAARSSPPGAGVDMGGTAPYDLPTTY